MYKFSAKSLAKINDPKFHPKLKKLLIEAIKTSLIDFTVIETVRTIEKQKEYVAKGTSKTMKSRHIPSTNKSGYCEAFDIAPYPIDWKNVTKFDILGEHILKIAKNLNIKIRWGKTFKTLVDRPHFELAE